MIGVLALQGAFLEHQRMLEEIGEKVCQVRSIEDLKQCKALVIPGGESTAIGKLLKDTKLNEEIKERVENGMPVFGTCAGMILISKNIEGEMPHIPLFDGEVRRNGYGRQLGSFKITEKFEGIESEIPMVFIRAPYLKNVGENVNILSTVDGRIVAARQGNILVTSFHPELTEDTSVHRYFVESMIK